MRQVRDGGDAELNGELLGVAKGDGFWGRLDQLLATSKLRIDRPKGSQHPRYPSLVYPLDYGYLVDTTGGDGNAVDVWVGDGSRTEVTGVLCTVDLEKRDSEIKLLVGCTPDDARLILELHNEGNQSAIYIARAGTH